MSDDSNASSLLSKAIAALRDHAGAGGGAVPGQRAASAETGPGGADGALLRFAQGHGLVSSEEWLGLLSPLEGGNEHEIFQASEGPEHVLKVTEPDFRLRNGRDRIPKVTPLHYLERWHLANVAFGDAADLTAVFETRHGLRIGIRQPFVLAADRKAPNPSQQEINRWLRAAGFDYQSGAWIRKEDGLVMLDTHEGNFVLAHAGIRPVDVELYRLDSAKGPVIPWEITKQRLIVAGLEK
ncbi:MAG: hypothetical protein ACO1TE_15630 [Prosthecobacter sp.]